MPKLRKGFWIYLPVAIFAWIAPFNSSAKAEAQPGLNAVAYTITEAPPTRSDTIYQTCGSETENNINRNFNGEPIVGCPVDLFMVHYTGFITIPENNTINFMIAADDGGTIQIGDTEFGTWDEKGCSWSATTTAAFPADTYALDGWFYEYGGSTCFMLVWNINNTGWAVVPDSAFTTNGVPTTTTTSTTSTTTTTTTSTTTTTTTTEPPTTTIATTTTSSTTTLPIETTTTTTTSTTIPYVSPIIEVPTGTTSTTMPEVTIPELIPEETPILIPEEIPTEITDPTTYETYPYTTVDTDQTLPFTPILPSEDLCNGSNATVCPDQTLPSVGENISDAVLTNILDTAFTPDASTEEITAALDTILDADLSTEQFTAVMNAVLADTSNTEQVSEVLVSLLSSNLSGQELTIVMNTVFSAEANVEEMGAIVENLLDSNLSSAELEAVFTAAFDGDLSDAETVALAEEVLSSPLDDKEFGTVVNAIFDEKVSDEVLTQTFEAILTPELSDNKFAQVVNVLENATITNDQVAQVVDLVISQEGGVSEGQATELATSAKVLESVSGEQATEVFDAIVASDVTPENGLAIVDAVQDAPKAVKKSFEKELNVYEGVFDTYTAIGSGIPVSGRRVIIGVITVSFILPAPVVSRRVI